MTCSKSDEFLGDDLSVSDLNNVKCDRGKVFVVEPNGVDDTENLIQAFTDANNSGKGSVVKLIEGDYYIGFIEIHEFNGLFLGAGKGKTIITPHTGLDCAALASQGLWNFLISFVGGNIYMSDMTLKIPSGTICSDGNGFDGIVFFSDYNSIYTSEKHYINASVNNVEFIGQQLGDWWYNCWQAIAVGCNTRATSGLNRSHIDMTVTNCAFEAFGWGTHMQGLKKGNLILGTKNKGNIFSNCTESAIFWDNINVRISAVGNKFNIPLWYWGLEIDNYDIDAYVVESQPKSIFCTVEGNEFNLVGGTCGLWFHDHRLISNPEENSPMLLLANNNQINMSNEAYAGMYIYECKGPVFLNNNFTGTGSLGIEVAPSGTADCYAENGFILGNNFSNSNFSIASIRLTEWTKNWTVIGRGNSNETIINLGTDNVIKEMHSRMNDKTFDIPHRRHPAFNKRLDEKQD